MSDTENPTETTTKTLDKAGADSAKNKDINARAAMQHNGSQATEKHQETKAPSSLAKTSKKEIELLVKVRKLC